MKNQFEIGQEVETTVVQVSGDTVFIDLGLKSEGFINAAEFTDDDGNVNIHEGDTVKAYFVGDSRGELHFTTRLSGESAGNEMLEKAYQAALPVEGAVEKEIKGGFEVKIGSNRAFCPYSQMGYKNREEPGAYVGRHMTFVITEYKNNGKDVIVSNRRVLEAAENEKKAALAQKLTVGAVVTGTVKSLQSYGAFVDVEGFQTLLPISEISHARVQDVADVLTVGQEIKAKIIKADWVHEKISLSTKSLEKDPWDEASAQFAPGTKVEGTIARIAGFGLFVNLAPGIDGLVHVSTLEDVGANTNLAKKYKIGQKFDVVVEKVDSAEKRISLKPATASEQDNDAASYLARQHDDGESYNPFAALLKR
ncbi:MAG: S1 RNA-binding domain-containing protein [Treponema sp.]|nr:S1 RNA-binding domain-containing protein [Treponema sp.]